MEYIVGPPATPTTDITNNRRSMSSPGGEETGEGGQFYANGAIFASIEEICRAPYSMPARGSRWFADQFCV